MFTPTLDVTTGRRFGRSGETFGECPFVTAEMGRAYVNGYRSDLTPASTVAACVKHYVAGGASQDGVNHATAELSERTLRTVYLAPFKTVGYRWFDAKKIKPLFPFGYGLSYTAFAFGKSVVEASVNDTVSIRVPVTNNGAREGSEVVQLYVHDNAPSLPRPPNELKAFEKLRLATGETREATLTVRAQHLAYWSVADKAWKVRAGRYEARIGDSSADLPLTVGLEYDGSTLKPAAR